MRSRIEDMLPLALCATIAASSGAAQSLAAPSTPVLVPASTVDPSSAWGSTVDPPTACMASLSPATMERQAIYLDARMAPGTSDVLLNQADLLASDVATTLNAMLASPKSPLASITANMKFYSVPAELIVVARRTGEMSWRGVSQSGDSSAYTVLATALDSARHQGGAVMLWPEGFTEDSLVLRLSLLPLEFRGATAVHPGDKIAMRFPAFALPTPKVTSPRLQSGPPHYMPYPAHPGSDRISGFVRVEFVVDTTGRVAMSTLHDLWPADMPRLTGTKGAYYDQLLGRIKAYEQNAAYSAAKVGSCKVPAFEVATFSFDGTLSTDRYSKWE